MGVVEYIPDDANAGKEMARVTKPGGIIIITLPNGMFREIYMIWEIPANITLDTRPKGS